MEVPLSDKAKKLLANAESRQQLATALTTSTQQRQTHPPVVSDGKETYTVVFGTDRSGDHK